MLLLVFMHINCPNGQLTEAGPPQARCLSFLWSPRQRSLRFRDGGFQVCGNRRSLHVFVGSLPGAGASPRRPGIRQWANDHVPFERSEFLASANPGESHQTLQAPPQRVRELGERESANAIALWTGVLCAPFPHKACRAGARGAVA